jgi:ABC-type transport system involved in multi-copper enzyme maturation permease subunit
MSTPPFAAALPALGTGGSWGRQLAAIVSLELRRRLTWRNAWLLFLGFAPVVVIGGHSLDKPRGCDVYGEGVIFAAIFQFFYLRLGMFFACLGIFTALVRGEMAERSLHYLLLAPVRRELLLVGKFLAGVLVTLLVLGTGVATAFLVMFAHFPAGRAFLLYGAGLSHLGSYLLVTLLACLGYGAVFLAASLALKNPVGPAVGLFLWEGINGALPLWLKRLSVTFYLKPLCPVEPPVPGFLGLFTVVAEPIPAWVAVTGLLAFVVLVLAAASRGMRSLEINYTTD